MWLSTRRNFDGLVDWAFFPLPSLCAARCLNVNEQEGPIHTVSLAWLVWAVGFHWCMRK